MSVVTIPIARAVELLQAQQNPGLRTLIERLARRDAEDHAKEVERREGYLDEVYGVCIRSVLLST